MQSNSTPNNGPVLAPPAGTDRDWQAKIAKAKAAREHGQALRAGKPTSFRASVGRTR